MPLEQLLGHPQVIGKAQILVIGTGAGGSVIGAELAKKGLDVAFVEAGAFHDAESFRATPLETLRKTYLAGGLNIAYGRPSIQFQWANRRWQHDGQFEHVHADP